VTAWSTTTDAFATWQARLGVSTWSESPLAAKFVAQVLALGARTEVFSIGDGQGPSDAVRDAWLGRGSARTLFPEQGPAGLSDDDPRMWSRLRVEGRDVWSHDLGALRKQLGPVEVTVPSVTAIEMAGPLVVERDAPMLVALSLPCDVWFAEVIDRFGTGGRVLQGPDAAEGRRRFNAFLAGVRDAVRATGGVIELDEVDERYAAQVTPSGLRS